MKIIATKLRGNPNNDRFGYLNAHLIHPGSNWEIATNVSVPKSGEVFIHRGYEALIDRVFRENELITLDVESLEYPSGDCVYGAMGKEARSATLEDDVVTILETDFLLAPQEVYRVSSRIKPTTYTFLKMYRKTGEEVIVGPFRASSSQYDPEEMQWVSLLNLVDAGNRYFTKLESYSVYTIEPETIPNEMIFEPETKNGSKFIIGMGLLAHLNHVPTEQTSLISDSALIKLIDLAAPPNFKLGRKGKRDLALQISASRKLSATLTERMVRTLKKSRLAIYFGTLIWIGYKKKTKAHTAKCGPHYVDQYIYWRISLYPPPERRA